MSRILDIGEADLSAGERLFARSVTQYPPRSITLGQLLRHALELFCAVFAISAVVGFIVMVA